MSKLYTLAYEIICGGAPFTQTADDYDLSKEERKELRRIIKTKKEWLG